MPTRSSAPAPTLLLAVFLLSTAPAAAPAQVSWYDANWSHRIEITADTASLAAGESLADFPVLLDGTVLADPMQRARADGADLVVTAADGVTVLPVEIVSFDRGAGTAEVWFRATTLSAEENRFYVYYGNAEADGAPTPSVWSDDYVAVYHFEEDPGAGVLADWTSAGNDARSNQPTSQWTSDDRTAGLIGRGWSFDGTTHYINTDRVRTQDGSFTVSAWLLHTTRSTDFFFQSNPGFWQLASQASSNSHHAQYKDGSVQSRYYPEPIPLDEFHHFAWVFDEVGRTVSFYFDGVEQDTQWFWPSETDPEDFYVGYSVNPDGSDLVGILGPMYHNDLDLFNGIGDEFRLSEAMLSTAWLATEVANQSDPSAFFTVSGEETATSTPTESFGRFKSGW